MHMAEPVMKLYTEATDGSYIETKESALVWHHQDADPGFGSAQAKEMLDHLESVLANEPVSVKSGQHIVEVKPQVLNFSKTHYVLCMVEIDTYVMDVHVPHTMCKIVYLLGHSQCRLYHRV
jgi:trehalose-phosphatase